MIENKGFYLVEQMSVQSPLPLSDGQTPAPQSRLLHLSEGHKNIVYTPGIAGISSASTSAGIKGTSTLTPLWE